MKKDQANFDFCEAHLARWLRAEALRQRPEFSPELHERLCASLRREVPHFDPARRRRWPTVAAAAAVAALLIAWPFAAPDSNHVPNHGEIADNNAPELRFLAPIVPFDIMTLPAGNVLLADELAISLRRWSLESTVELVVDDVRAAASAMLSWIPPALPDLPETATNEAAISDPAVL